MSWKGRGEQVLFCAFSQLEGLEVRQGQGVSSSLPCQSEAALLDEKIFTLHIMDKLGAGSRGALERFDVLGEITNR